MWAGVSLAAMVVLVQIRNSDSMLAAEHYPVREVFICCGMTAICLTLALLFAIPVFLTENYTPGFWLVPAFVMLAAFMLWYDWEGVFNYGKSRQFPTYPREHAEWLLEHDPL